MVVIWGWERGVIGVTIQWVQSFSFVKLKPSGDGWLHNNVNIPNDTELHT